MRARDRSTPRARLAEARPFREKRHRSARRAGKNTTLQCQNVGTPPERNSTGDPKKSKRFLPHKTRVPAFRLPAGVGDVVEIRGFRARWNAFEASPELTSAGRRFLVRVLATASDVLSSSPVDVKKNRPSTPNANPAETLAAAVDARRSKVSAWALEAREHVLRSAAAAAAAAAAAFTAFASASGAPRTLFDERSFSSSALRRGGGVAHRAAEDLAGLGPRTSSGASSPRRRSRAARRPRTPGTTLPRRKLPPRTAQGLGPARVREREGAAARGFFRRRRVRVRPPECSPPLRHPRGLPRSSLGSGARGCGCRRAPARAWRRRSPRCPQRRRSERRACSRGKSSSFATSASGDGSAREGTASSRPTSSSPGRPRAKDVVGTSGPGKDPPPNPPSPPPPPPPPIRRGDWCRGTTPSPPRSRRGVPPPASSRAPPPRGRRSRRGRTETPTSCGFRRASRGRACRTPRVHVLNPPPTRVETSSVLVGGLLRANGAGALVVGCEP